MKIQSQRKYLLSLESVAMTDIVLNMFIFFFISFSLLYTFSPERISKIDVKLPKASNTAPLDKVSIATVTITRSGLFFLNEKQVNAARLKSELENYMKENSSLVVDIRADRGAAFRYIVNVLDVLTELGIDKVSIATEQDKE